MRTASALLATGFLATCLGACASADLRGAGGEVPVSFTPRELDGVERQHVQFRDRWTGDEVWRVMMRGTEGFAVVDYRRNETRVLTLGAQAVIPQMLRADAQGDLRWLEAGHVPAPLSGTDWRTFLLGTGKAHCISLERAVDWHLGRGIAPPDPAAAVVAVLCRYAKPLEPGDPARLSAALRPGS